MPPLDNDPECNGKPADHLMVVMKPISEVNNESAIIKKTITYRPFNSESVRRMTAWIEEQDWSLISNENSVQKKMELLQNLLVSKYEELFPERTKTLCSEDQPFFTNKLHKMKRRKAREFRKHRKSIKWKIMNKFYQKELELEKRKYYDNKIKKLVNTNPKFWHRELKKLTGFENIKSEDLIVDSIKDLPENAQAELIAENVDY